MLTPVPFGPRNRDQLSEGFALIGAAVLDGTAVFVGSAVFAVAISFEAAISDSTGSVVWAITESDWLSGLCDGPEPCRGPCRGGFRNAKNEPPATSPRTKREAMALLKVSFIRIFRLVYWHAQATEPEERKSVFRE